MVASANEKSRTCEDEHAKPRWYITYPYVLESIIDFSSSKEEPLDPQQEEVLELLLFQSSNDDDSSGGNNEPTAGSNNHKETNSIYAAVD